MSASGLAALRLRALRERAGLSMQALAVRVGTSAPQINKLEKGERRLTLEWLERLAQALGVELTALFGDGSPAVPGTSAADDLIPLLAAEAGDDHRLVPHAAPVGLVPRPPALQHVRDAYALVMVGTTMLPRFREGQMLHVNPHRPPQPGSGVVVTLGDGTLVVGEFVGRSGRTIELRRYRPDEVFSVTPAPAGATHAIVGLTEP